MSLCSNYLVVLVKLICITSTKNGDVMVGAELNDTTKIFKTLRHEVNFQSLMDMLHSLSGLCTVIKLDMIQT